MVPLPTDMTPPVAARALGCSPPTLRKLVAEGILPATETKRGERTFLTLRATDIDDYIAKHGQFNRRSNRTGATSDDEFNALRDQVAALQRQVDQGRNGQVSDTRAEVVALGDALHLQRAAMAALLEADEARATGTGLLLDAIRAFEVADGKRREAITSLDQVVGALTLPGNVEGLD